MKTESGIDYKEFVTKQTGRSGWKYFDGPSTGVGTEYWLRSGRHEAYICNDQGHVEITVDGDNIFSGWEDEIKTEE